MRKLVFLLLLVFVSPIFLIAGEEEEKEAIKKVITSAYVDGLQNKGPASDIEAGFHPGFNLLGVRNNVLTKLPIYSWVQYHEKNLKKDPNPPAPEDIVTSKFPMVDITGNAAIVKIELYRGGQQIYTDYLSLYKFEEGWKIVGKIYYQHEEKKE